MQLQGPLLRLRLLGGRDLRNSGVDQPAAEHLPLHRLSGSQEISMSTGGLEIQN